MPISNVFSGSGEKLQFEDLSDQCNGSRQVFTVSKDFESGSLRVYWNGVRQSGNEITVQTAATFQTSFHPASTASIIVEFYKK